jgi:hypothetical protein
VATAGEAPRPEKAIPEKAAPEKAARGAKKASAPKTTPRPTAAPVGKAAAPKESVAASADSTVAKRAAAKKAAPAAKRPARKGTPPRVSEPVDLTPPPPAEPTVAAPTIAAPTDTALTVAPSAVAPSTDAAAAVAGVREVPEVALAEPWARLVADPAHAPELLALAAVQSVGPRARDWVARAKRDYPAADRAALARLATSQFARAGSLGSVFGAVAGSYAPGVLTATAAVVHAELILHVAAAYGVEPDAPERAVDLLVITRVHADREAASAAVAAARRPAYEEDGGLRGVWRLGRLISGPVGGWGLFRLINRYLPGAGLLAAFLSGRAATDSVAARANAHYRGLAAED